MSARDDRIVRVGSRKSELALIQTSYVISQLKQLHPDKEFEIVTMTTLGDRVLNISLPKIGEKSLFTKDLEEALENGSVDLVVHSLKDLPTTLPKNMAIGAVLEREDPRDALVLRKDFQGHTLETLPKGSIIGTSSLRRTAQLSRTHQHLVVMDIRGNLNTRLKKLDQNCTINGSTNNVDTETIVKNGIGEDQLENPNYAGLVLAQAGLLRMGWQSRISQVLPSPEVLYAIGQGALAIECRADHQRILDLIAPLNHARTYCRILAERTFLRTLGGGCSAPVAISTDINDQCTKMEITGAVWSLNGKTKLQESIVHSFNLFDGEKKSCPYDSATKLNGTTSNNKMETEHRLSEKMNPIKTLEDIETNSNRKELENNRGKHKLNNILESVIDIDEPNAKLNKTEVDSSCPGSNAAVSSQGKCCRLKSLNEVMNCAKPIDIENIISFHEKLVLPCRESCPVFEFPPDFLEMLSKLHPEVHDFRQDFEKCPVMANQAVANAILTGGGAKIVPQYDMDKPKKCTFLIQKRQEQVRNAIDGIREIAESNGNGFSKTVGKIEEPSKAVSKKEVKLFCGLSKHFDIAEEVLDGFEELGRQLAQKLIDHGAIDVMKCAQDYIRGATGSTAAVISSS